MEDATVTESEHSDPGAPKAKTVMFHTGVILGPHLRGLDEPMQKVSYVKDQCLHSRAVPQVCQELPHTIVIDLPVRDTNGYVQQYLFWMAKRGDAALVSALANYLSDTKKTLKAEPQQIRACHINILGSQWFREQPDE